jgi:glycosyltransferase involved in cell wall biosynthesis
LRSNKNKTDIPDLLRVRGAKVTELSYRKLFDPRTIPTLMILLKKERPDIVHTHLSHANILGSVAASAVNIPVVATLHNTHSSGTGKLDLRSRIERYCLRNLTTRVIAVGEKVADVYRPLIKNDRLDVIPNSVSVGQVISLQKRAAIRTEIAGDPTRTIVIAVGRLRLQKGYYDLLTAFAQAHKRCPDAFLVIVGVGSLLDSLIEHSQSLGISEQVRFLGARDDVPQLLAAVDLFVNSSHFEGLSIAMLEAMAAGLPVLATRVGDAEVLLSKGSGLLVEAQNPVAFANALESLLINPEKLLSMGKVARACVENNYTADGWLDKLLTCYALAQGTHAKLVNKL